MPAGAVRSDEGRSVGAGPIVRSRFGSRFIVQKLGDSLRNRWFPVASYLEFFVSYFPYIVLNTTSAIRFSQSPAPNHGSAGVEQQAIGNGIRFLLYSR